MNQDPLAQLRDIHMPGAIGFWPPAPGWWLLAALIIASMTAYVIVRYLRAEKNKYRHEAINALVAAWKNHTERTDPQAYLLALTQILKRTALTAYPNSNVNGMCSRAWLALLDDTLPGNKLQFLQGPGQQLLDLPYRQADYDIDLTSLHNLALRWLRDHHPERVIIKPSFQPKSAAITLTEVNPIEVNPIEVNNATT